MDRLDAKGIHTIAAEFGAGILPLKMCEQLEDLNVAFDLIHFHRVYRNTLPQNMRDCIIFLSSRPITACGMMI